MLVSLVQSVPRARGPRRHEREIYYLANSSQDVNNGSQTPYTGGAYIVDC